MAAALLTTAAFAPQAIRVRRSRSTKDVSPAGFGAYLRADIEKWTRVIREANIRVE